MILTPEDQQDTQLDILSSIAKAFAGADDRQTLLQAGDRERAWRIIQQRLHASLRR